MAASSNGLGKKALAAWLSWCSVKTSRARRPLPRAPRIVRGMCSFSLSQSGMAIRKLRKPKGANARYVSSSRSNFVSGLS